MIFIIRRVIALLALVSFSITGCLSVDELDDLDILGPEDGGSDTDTTDTDTGDTDTGDTDTGETEEGCGTWYEDVLGRYWEKCMGMVERVSFEDAQEYCQNLSLDGESDWRLPNIDELRTLIRGCPDSEYGGACIATDGSGPDSNWVEEDCLGCPYMEGPAIGGCYWPDELEGECADGAGFWTTSFFPSSENDVWAFGFANCRLESTYTDEHENRVRCVRDPGTGGG